MLSGQDNNPFNALLAEDDESTRLLVAWLLEQEGLHVREHEDGREVVDAARERQADLIVLDVDLPSQDGFEACRQIRTFSDAYVLMLTGKDGEVDKVAGFAAGCDDYVTKPFSPAELLGRIRALKRRLPDPQGSPLDLSRSIGALTVDPQSRRVSVDGADVELTRTEFDLLDVLSGAPRVAFSRDQLIELVWGADWFGDEHLIDVHISNLRRKLGSPAFIATVGGVGYRMGAG